MFGKIQLISIDEMTWQGLIEECITNPKYPKQSEH